jgi:hypothetical protein
MDKWEVTKVGGVTLLAFAIGAQIGQQPGVEEMPTSQETQGIGPELAKAVRVLDADLHTHRDRQSSVDQPIGQDAANKAQSDVSVPFVPTMDDNELRRYRQAAQYAYDQGEWQTPFPLRFL